MKPGRPKNNGTILTIRIRLHSHAQLAGLLERRILEGMRPGQATKTRIVEEAIDLLYNSTIPEGSKLCENCGLILPKHAPGCWRGIPAVPKIYGKVPGTEGEGGANG